MAAQRKCVRTAQCRGVACFPLCAGTRNRLEARRAPAGAGSNHVPDVEPPSGPGSTSVPWFAAAARAGAHAAARSRTTKVRPNRAMPRCRLLSVVRRHTQPSGGAACARQGRNAPRSRRRTTVRPWFEVGSVVRRAAQRAAAQRKCVRTARWRGVAWFPLCAGMRNRLKARGAARRGRAPRTTTPAGPGGTAGVRRAAGAGSGSAASAGGATLQRAALVLAQATPDTGVLVVLECVLQAHLGDRAASADRLGLLDLVDGRSGVPDGEEELGVRGEAGCRSRQSMCGAP